MMEIQPFRGKHYDADCRKCETSFRGSLKQVTEVREAHNARLHPRRHHREQRRLEILAEISGGPMLEVFMHADPLEAGGWDHALPFEVPPLDRARLKEEGLLPVAPEEYRREFPVGREKETHDG